MLVNDITVRLERQSLREDNSVATHDQKPTLEGNFIVESYALGCDDIDEKSAPIQSPSPLIRGTSSRMSLPFSGGIVAPRSAFIEAYDKKQSSSIADVDVDQLPIKRRHCSWAAADFRLHTCMSSNRLSDTNRFDSDCNGSAVIELVKPIPVRPVLAKNGCASEFCDSGFCKDDFGIGKKYVSVCHSVPRPSSASSGIFDLDSSSECSARRGDLLDQFSNGWSFSSSADERRRSDEDNARHFAFRGRNLAKATVGCGRHCRAASSRLSASGGFLPLVHRADGHGACNLSSSSGTQVTPQNALTVPCSNKASTTSWWRSAPDLVGSACSSINCSQASDEDSDWRRSQRKRNLSGRLQARPSIDLFKNVGDDDSSCGADSFMSSEGACSDTNDTCLSSKHFVSAISSNDSGVNFTVNATKDSTKATFDVANRDDDETDSDSNSLANSVRSSTGTFTLGTGLSSEPTPVTRSLSYPWLRSHGLGDEHWSKTSRYETISHRKSIGIIRRPSGRSANVVPTLIDDGLRTIVGSPADTVTAVANAVGPLVSSDNSVTVSPTTGLLNYVADTIGDCCVSGQPAVAGLSGCAAVEISAEKLVLDSLSRNQSVQEIQSSETANDYIAISTERDVSNTRLLAPPPQLIDGPVMFLPRYNFQTELDIDLIEQN